MMGKQTSFTVFAPKVKLFLAWMSQYMFLWVFLVANAWFFSSVGSNGRIHMIYGGLPAIFCRQKMAGN
jgi:hypothetical protein